MHTFYKLIFGTLLLVYIAADARCEEIAFEAESHTEITAPMKIVDQDTSEKDQDGKPQKVSGKKFLEIKQGDGEGSKVGGAATYKIMVPKDGNYYLWARVWWLDSCGNSFAIAVNNKPDLIFGNDRTYKSWHWVKSRVRLKLKKGEQTIKISNREDGIRIDQFLLTDDRQYIPVDIEATPNSAPAK